MKHGRWGVLVLGLLGFGCSSVAATEDDFELGLAQERLANSLELAEGERVNWWQGGRTQRHTGFNPFEASLSTANVAGLEVLWSRPLENSWRGSITVFNGHAFVTDGKRDFSGETLALNEDTGELVWSVAGTSELGLEGLDVVSHGRILVGQDFQDTVSLAALKSTSGREVPWSSHTVVDADEFFGTPLTAAGRYVYQCRTVSSGPVAQDVLYQISIDTGARLRVTTPYSSLGWASTPIVANGRVFVSGWADVDLSRVLVFDAETLAPVPDTFENGFTAFRPTVAYAGFLYGALGQYTTRLASVDARTGRLIWSAQVSASGAYDSRLTSVSEDSVFALVREGLEAQLVALDRRTGGERFRTALTTGRAPRSDSAPTSANGVVYVTTGDGKFFAVDGNSGAILKTLSGDYRGSPVVVNGRVLLVSRTGVFALGLP